MPSRARATPRARPRSVSPPSRPRGLIDPAIGVNAAESSPSLLDDEFAHARDVDALRGVAAVDRDRVIAAHHVERTRALAEHPLAVHEDPLVARATADREATQLRARIARGEL